MNKDFVDWLLEKECYPVTQGLMLLETWSNNWEFNPAGIKQVKYRIIEYKIYEQRICKMA